MPKEHFFKAHTVWSGAPAGSTTNYESYSREFSYSVEGKPTITGSAAGAFKGDESLPNPEDMLLGALSACHLLSFLAVAAWTKIEVLSYEDDCTATMAFSEGKMRFTEVTLRPVVTVATAEMAEKVNAAHDRAAKECFIASSVNFPVHHEPRTIVAG